MSSEDEVPRIAIIGAGPIGLEAALYGRYLGLEVAVFEQGTVADSVNRWGHVQMFSPFRMNRSPLGIAALRAQTEDLELPGDDELLTGADYAARYLLPLAHSDLLHGCIHEHVQVVSVGRDGLLKSDTRDVDREEFNFRLLVRSEGGDECVDADVVIDASGVFRSPNHVGHGGVAALGELQAAAELDYHVPDVLGRDRARFENQQTLVIGGGYSAATVIVALGELIKSAPATKVTWLTRRGVEVGEGPMPRKTEDRLPARDALAAAANQLVLDENSGITHVSQSAVLGVSNETEAGKLVVTTGGQLEGQHAFDRVIANVGYRPDASLLRELAMDLDPWSEGTRKLAEELRALGTPDCLDLEAKCESIIQLEPDFYLLGSKSFGRDSNFLLSFGLQQIRDAYTLIADRETLDLYKTMDHLAT